MSQTNHLLSIPKNCEAALADVLITFQQFDLQTARSFDLNVARSLHSDCSCPNHGMEKCDCQMVVLLVYGNFSQPVTLVAHGYDGQTQFRLVNSPQQHPDPILELRIRQAFAEVVNVNLSQWIYRNAS